MIKSRKNRVRRAGFTLVEASLALALMGLLFIGAVNLYITATRTAAGATAQSDASARAANAFGRVNDDTREAYYIDLPDDAVSDRPSSFTPASGRTAGDYIAADGTDTAIQLTYQATSAKSVFDSGGTARVTSPAP